MAFYSVHYDDENDNDNDNEIISSARTFSKLNIEPVVKNNYKTVRYVNPAASIERDVKKHYEEPPSPKETTDAPDPSAGDSDKNAGQYQSHIADFDTIPALELFSEESYPSSSDMMSYSYRKMCQVTKMIEKPDAFKEWLEAKKTVKLYEKKKKMAEKQRLEEEQKNKKKLAEELYNHWLEKKRKQLLEKKREEPTPPTKEDNDNKTNNINKTYQKDNFQAWLRKKLQEMKEEKSKVTEETQKEEELRERRLEEAERIYQMWLKQAPFKPKPVPLNQGLATLCGTNSEHYVNPAEWISDVNIESSNTVNW